MSADGLDALFNRFGLQKDSIQAQKLRRYLSLLKKWNVRINLTSSTEWGALEPMVREGVWSAQRYPKDASTHLDIGSGAGFPAIVLKIFNPRMKLQLVESRGKKAAFLETAIYELDFAETMVLAHRLQTLIEETPKTWNWDCISWKAIKLRSAELEGLKDHCGRNSQFWMFHGREPAIDFGTADMSGLELIRKDAIPGARESWLSIYRPRRDIS